MSNQTKYTADILQEIFGKTASGEKTIEQFALWLNVSVGSIKNYMQAKKKYDSGLEVSAQNVSMPVFAEWAHKYGKAGEARFKKEPSGRKHTKKKVEQQKMDLPGLTDQDISIPSADPVTEEDNETLRIRVSFELGETAKKAIDGLLALVGVKL